MCGLNNKYAFLCSGKLKINLEADLVSTEDLLSGLQMAVCCYVAKREEVSSLVSLLIRSPIPSRGLYPHDLQWVILLVKLTGLRNFQMAGKPLFLSLSVRVFLEEISIWIDRLSKEDQPHQCGWAQRIWTNIKEETFDIWHLSPDLSYWHCWFLGFWTQTELYHWLPWFSRQQIVGLGLHYHVSQFLE